MAMSARSLRPEVHEPWCCGGLVRRLRLRCRTLLRAALLCPPARLRLVRRGLRRGSRLLSSSSASVTEAARCKPAAAFAIASSRASAAAAFLVRRPRLPSIGDRRIRTAPSRHAGTARIRSFRSGATGADPAPSDCSAVRSATRAPSLRRDVLPLDSSPGRHLRVPPHALAGHAPSTRPR